MEAAGFSASKVDQVIPVLDTDAQSIDKAYAHVLNEEYREALQLYLPLADNGNEKAVTALFSMFKDANVVRQIIDACRKASDCGYKVVSYLMGELYHRGNGVIERNDEQALHFYEQADKLGYLRATHRLGMMYYRGDGVPQDYSKALTCFEKVYASGNKQAAHNLGNMYYFGHGVAKNISQAYLYYSEGSAAGFEVSKRQIEKIHMDSPMWGNGLSLLGNGLSMMNKLVNNTAGEK